MLHKLTHPRYEIVFAGANFLTLRIINTKAGIRNSRKVKKTHCFPVGSLGILKPTCIKNGQATKRLPNTRVVMLNNEPIILNKSSTLFITYNIIAQNNVMTIIYTIGEALKIIFVK